MSARVVVGSCWFLSAGLMKASQETRAANADSITQKEADKASWQEKIENAKEEQLSSLDALEKVLGGAAGELAFCMVGEGTGGAVSGRCSLDGACLVLPLRRRIAWEVSEYIAGLHSSCDFLVRGRVGGECGVLGGVGLPQMRQSAWEIMLWQRH